MKDSTAEEKLKIIDEALLHFYDIDTETLLNNYSNYLGIKMSEHTVQVLPDKKTAIEYFKIIPSNCYNNKPVEMKKEMLTALTEEEITNLCEEQVKLHPVIEMEIRSMFEYCIKIKKMIES